VYYIKKDELASKPEPSQQSRMMSKYWALLMETEWIWNCWYILIF